LDNFILGLDKDDIIQHLKLNVVHKVLNRSSVKSLLGIDQFGASINLAWHQGTDRVFDTIEQGSLVVVL